MGESDRGRGRVVNLAEAFATVRDHWSPRIIAQINDFYVKAVRLKGAFVWHAHADTDELFLVTRGRLVIRLRDREVALGAGDLFVVPRGVEHQPVADEECEVLLIEPVGTANTGDAGGPGTTTGEWI